VAATPHTPPAPRLRLLLLVCVSCRPKLSFIDYFCNLFIKRQKLLKIELSPLKTNNLAA